eukprot:CAMPEP_0194360796 /NCGR_PEP_ID=MMETSP0174-20130528/8230_1 /TAXON_ID=216777 /ORGANISM="Proboscia alata, Strain PI-D3" /LENGTH=527 /DNA_ID=CAMNT_0039132537 /DNA_START=57 /DNA_END=1640 /DNA_ORIENTATION=+
MTNHGDNKCNNKIEAKFGYIVYGNDDQQRKSSRSASNLTPSAVSSCFRRRSSFVTSSAVKQQLLLIVSMTIILLSLSSIMAFRLESVTSTKTALSSTRRRSTPPLISCQREHYRQILTSRKMSSPLSGTSRTTFLLPIQQQTRIKMSSSPSSDSLDSDEYDENINIDEDDVLLDEDLALLDLLSKDFDAIENSIDWAEFNIPNDINDEVINDADNDDWVIPRNIMQDDVMANEFLAMNTKNVIGSDDDDITAGATAVTALEQALLQGVVPADAGVGSNCLPGDYGFDPLNLATTDYILDVQTFLLKLLPESDDEDTDGNDGNNDYETNEQGADVVQQPRPSGLILRDYREAEIRHGRLAMLAAILWPLQEILDRILLIPTIESEFYSTTVPYGGVTLPFIPLFMTLIMMLLGYLDIYAKSVKDYTAGEAFLPGECFWDPLSMLDGAPEIMKRRMQSRELMNGRLAMVAVSLYFFEELFSHEALIMMPVNMFLFEPAFTIPSVQAWLDSKFMGGSPLFITDEFNELLE